jgi:hypothetical protein
MARPGVEGLEMDLGEVEWMGWTALVCFRIGTMWELLLFSNEPSGFIKFWETIGWLHNWWPLV